MILNNTGLMIFNQWMGLVEKYPMIGLDAFVIMPNHMHGVIEIMSEDEFDPERPLIDRVLPDDIAVAHPHRNELLAWVERRNTERLNQGIIPPNHNSVSRVGARFIAPRNNPLPVSLKNYWDRIKATRGVMNHAPTLGEIVRRFKAGATYQIRRLTTNTSFSWQRDFFDSILWTDQDLDNVRDYILENPKNWERDMEYIDS